MAPKCSAENLFSVPEPKKPVVCLSEKNTCLKWASFVLSYRAAGCELMLLNEQRILNKGSKTEAQVKQDYGLIGWWKCCEQRLVETQPSISLRSSGSVFSISIFTGLYRT